MMQVTNTEEIGKLVRATRKAQGLSQEALAGASGVGPRFIVELEKGKRTCEVGKVLLVMQMLGISVNVVPPEQLP